MTCGGASSDVRAYSNAGRSRASVLCGEVTYIVQIVDTWRAPDSLVVWWKAVHETACPWCGCGYASRNVRFFLGSPAWALHKNKQRQTTSKRTNDATKTDTHNERRETKRTYKQRKSAADRPECTNPCHVFFSFEAGATDTRGCVHSTKRVPEIVGRCSSTPWFILRSAGGGVGHMA